MSAAPPEMIRGRDREMTSRGKLLLILIELCFTAAVVYLYEIEGRRHFFPVLCLILTGSMIHMTLPRRLRVGFFALLSVATILFVLGVTQGTCVLVIGGALIAICYLPVSFRARVTLLVASCGLLVWGRSEYELPFWPVLGSMFMFRMIVFVVELRKARTQPSLTSAVAYFFMVPNPCFLLFPVVDYRTFCDSWYDEDEWEIYQRGVAWIVRGISHLLLYRFVKQHLVPEPWQMDDLPHVALFMATNYALYLQVSGQFHLITGLLHLFGWNLPRTHFLFFLASSCSDIWRRINIYWKDFMQKVFFLPAFFQLRRRSVPMKFAMAGGVVVVFLSTWLLHSWQAFWLLGGFPVTVNDAGLWLGAGLLVAVNAVLELRSSGNRGSIRQSAWHRALRVSASTVGMFFAVSLFWACWTRPGFLAVFPGLLQRPGWAGGLAVLAAWMLGLIFGGTLLARLPVRKVVRSWEARTASFADSAKVHAVLLAALIAVGLPGFRELFDDRVSGMIAEFQSDADVGDAASRLESYYEVLNASPIQAGPLLSSLSSRDSERRAAASEYEAITRRAEPPLEIELIPGVTGTLKGKEISINQFGMRDRQSIELDKPAGTIRIALVGSSVVMGYGVADDEVFSRLLEARLNASHPDSAPRYEVLNFGVGKYYAIHRCVLFERKVLAFQPDAVFYVAHQEEPYFPARQLAELTADGDISPDPCLSDLLDRAGVTPGMAHGRIDLRLHGRDSEILTCLYRGITDTCRERGIVPVWIYIPVPGVPDSPPDPSATLLPLARDAGFTVLDLADWYAGHQLTDFKDDVESQHPNAFGHELICERLFRALERTPAALPTEPAESVR